MSTGTGTGTGNFNTHTPKTGILRSLLCVSAAPVTYVHLHPRTPTNNYTKLSHKIWRCQGLWKKGSNGSVNGTATKHV